MTTTSERAPRRCVVARLAKLRRPFVCSALLTVVHCPCGALSIMCLCLCLQRIVFVNALSPVHVLSSECIVLVMHRRLFRLWRIVDRVLLVVLQRGQGPDLRDCRKRFKTAKAQLLELPRRPNFGAGEVQNPRPRLAAGRCREARGCTGRCVDRDADLRVMRGRVSV